MGQDTQNDGLTPNRMRAFLAVVRSLNFTVAAREMHLSQSAVSRQIAALEESLRTKLFDRRGSHIALTHAGRALRPEASRILGDIERAQEVVRDIKDRDVPHLRIGASTTPGLYVLPRAVREFQKRHPHVLVQFTLSNTAKIEALLIENALDIGLVGSRGQSDELVVEPLVEDEIVCVAHPRHRLVSRRAVAVSKLHGEPLILREEGSATRKAFMAWLEANGGEATRTIDVGCPEAVKSLTRARLGIGVTSSLSIRDKASRSGLAVLRIAAPRLTRVLWSVIHPQKHVGTALLAFRAEIQRSLGR